MNRPFALLCISAFALSTLPACDPSKGGEPGDSSSNTDESKPSKDKPAPDKPATDKPATDKPEPSDEKSKAGSKDSPKEESKKPNPEDGESKSPEEKPDGAALGLACKEHSDCSSGVCREIDGLGPDAGTLTTCSQCADDEQCVDQKLGLGCLPTLDFVDGNPAPHYACTSGELGAECKTDKHCEDKLKCVDLEAGGPGAGMKTCSSCAKDSDCKEDAPLCLRDMAGFMSCKAEGSLPSGHPCDVGDRGDRACEDFCGPLDFGDEDSEPAKFGVCGECRNDGDCNEDQRCQPAKFEKGMVPAKCVAK